MAEKEVRTRHGLHDVRGTMLLSNHALHDWFYDAWSYPWTGEMPVHDRHRKLLTSITEPGRITSVMLTLDVGYHASGWWKNAEYDRCFHLSLCHPTRLAIEAPSDTEVVAWSTALFEEHAVKGWVEPPASSLDPHRLPNVAHVRVFLNEQGVPFIPEGEVYDLKPWPYGKAAESIGGDVR